MNLDDLAQRISPILDHVAVQLFLDWGQENWIVFFAAFAFFVGFVVGRRRASPASTFQTSGERLASRVLSGNFCPPDYHLMNHITLQLPDGTTQIDHILVSRFGIFVIETKGFRGWIFGGSSHNSWTQVLFGHKFHFQNPIRQNFRHVRAVQDLLDFLPRNAVKSVVLFSGSAEFKTEVPPGVYSVAGLIAYLKNQTVEVMSQNRMQFCVGRLETARLAISGKTDVEHVQTLQRRHGKSI